MTPSRLARRRLIAAGLAASSAAALPFAGRAADPVRLKLATFEPPQGMVISQVLQPFAKDVVAAANGTLQIDVFTGGTLGRNPLTQLKLVTDGIADIAWVVLPYTPGRFDDTEVVGLPFVATNSVEASVALQRLYQKDVLVGFGDLKMLALGVTPQLAIHANQPVRVPGDLKGKRVRVSGDHLTRVVRHLGGAVVQLGGGQIAEGMARGVTDMTLNNWGFVGDFKVNEVTTQHLDIALGAVPVGVAMRRDRYEALPAPAKAAMERFGGEALARRLGEGFDRQDREVRERVSKSPKNTVTPVPPADLAQWKAAIEPVNQAWRTASPRNQRVWAAYEAELGRVRSGR
jgi:TRAP-type C4-dicarboxylate transport system substrate-binding protein